MIYPENFERKIGFSEIRTLLKGRCMSSLGTEWVEREVKFLTNAEEVRIRLNKAKEFGTFLFDNDDEIENDFLDVREALMRVRPERTHLEELDLFSLKRSLLTIAGYKQAFLKTSDEPSSASIDLNSDDKAPSEKNAYLYPALGAMAEHVQTFPSFVKRIDEILNKYGKMKDTASGELLSLRHQIEINLRTISHSLRSIIIEAQSEGYIDRDVAPTIRDGRLVIPVAPALKKKIKGIVHDESASGKTVFIEPSAVVEANNRIRELRAAERREIIRILKELTDEIRPSIPAMLSTFRFLAEVDYLRALASFNETYNSIVPQLGSEPRIDWEQARHPLLEQSLAKQGSKMVALDISLNADARILLISGPNAGGKSVCLKTVGLLQYMLQCGLPVPVGERTKAGIFNDIFIDIGDEQSLENDLSTYSSHLLNMKQIIQKAGPKSLVLIDEFGSGTEPQIGGALAEAILRRFVKNYTYGIITTHYQNLKHFADSEPAVVNGAMLYDRAQMQPLFILQTGHPGSSFAIEIARKIGLPEDVIQYAADLVGKDYVLSDKYLQDIVRDKIYWEGKRKNIRAKEKQLDEALTNYEEALAEVKQSRKELITQAKEKALQLLDESNAKIENTIRVIREAQAEKEKTRQVRSELASFKEQLQQSLEEQDAIARKILQIERRKQAKAAGQKSAKQRHLEAQEAAAKALAKATSKPPKPQMPEAEGFCRGAFVRIKGQTTIGRIDSISGNSARVLFGMIFTLVPFKKLELADAPKKEPNLSQVSTFVSKETREAMYEKKLHYNPEIDIRGMHVDEALTAITYFIDDSIQLEQARVRILHGTGTGALRELVRNYLHTVIGVKTYHDEHVQFGGAGITVVEFD